MEHVNTMTFCNIRNNATGQVHAYTWSPRKKHWIDACTTTSWLSEHQVDGTRWMRTLELATCVACQAACAPPVPAPSPAQAAFAACRDAVLAAARNAFPEAKLRHFTVTAPGSAILRILHKLPDGDVFTTNVPVSETWTGPNRGRKVMLRTPTACLIDYAAQLDMARQLGALPPRPAPTPPKLTTSWRLVENGVVDVIRDRSIAEIVAVQDRKFMDMTRTPREPGKPRKARKARKAT